MWRRCLGQKYWHLDLTPHHLIHLYMYWVRFTCTSCVDTTADSVCFRFCKISAKLQDKLSSVCYRDIEKILISASSPGLMSGHRLRCWPDKKPTLFQCLVSVDSVNRRLWPIVGLMLSLFNKWWSNIKATFCQLGHCCKCPHEDLSECILFLRRFLHYIAPQDFHRKKNRYWDLLL